MKVRTMSMTRNLAALAVPLLTLAGALPAETLAAGPTEKAIETRIVSATVYGDRAQVVRSAHLALKPGLYRFLCDDLPKGFAESSLQVDGQGTARAAIVGIEIIERPGVVAETPRFVELQAKLEALKSSRDSLAIRLDALNKRREFLKRLAEYPFQSGAENQAAEVFRVGDWQNLMEFMETEGVAVADRARDLDKQLGDFNEKIRWHEAELNALRAQGQWGKRVAIDCDVAAAGSLDLNLMYIAPGASWQPQYTVRYLASQGQMELTYNAMIRQTTGEDWQGVAVVLSTARPHVGAAPPKLEPYFLPPHMATLSDAEMPNATDFQKYATDSVEEALAKQEGVVMRAGEMYVRGGRSEPTSFQLDQVGMQGASSDFATNLAIAKPVELSSGADPRRVMVLRQTFDGELERTAVPRLSPHVFIQGTFDNSLDVPILGGQAEVYVETAQAGSQARASNFVGRERVEAVAKGQEFVLHLGVDQDVKVTRERLPAERLSKPDAKRARMRYGSLITLENFKADSCSLTVQDRIPVVTDKAYELDDVEFEPEPAERQADGIIVWKLDLPPRARQEIRISYVVELPGPWSRRVMDID